MTYINLDEATIIRTDSILHADIHKHGEGAYVRIIYENGRILEHETLTYEEGLLVFKRLGDALI